MIVCKFGGTSVANKNTAKKIKEILKQNRNRKIIVVSALGKSEECNYKITDMLFKLYYAVISKEDYMLIVEKIFDRYCNLSKFLQVDVDWQFYKDDLLNIIKSGNFTKEFLVSRGEYYSAILYSKYLGLKFLDAKDYIIFNKNGTLNEKLTKFNLSKLNLNKRYIMGGFYGAKENGEICIFDRGGSDITGAIICKALNFDIYENFTDVDGVFNKNPNVFTNSTNLPILSVNTAIKMAECGNEVVHKDALDIIKNSKSLLVVKSTNNYIKLGTIVTYGLNETLKSECICVCGIKILIYKKNFVNIKKLLLGVEVLKILSNNSKLYVLVKNIFWSYEELKKTGELLEIVDGKLVSIFDESKIFNKKNLKKINKLKKKIKQYCYFCEYCSYLNNFNVVCNNKNYTKIVECINLVVE